MMIYLQRNYSKDLEKKNSVVEKKSSYYDKQSGVGGVHSHLSEPN